MGMRMGRVAISIKDRLIMIRMILAFALMLGGAKASALELYTEFPKNINQNEKYVFYSHGLIVEGSNPTPRHPEFGVYDFPSIKTELFKNGGFNLIAEHRPANSDPREYIQTLSQNVRALVDAGVEPRHIALIGFSRGAQITASASNQLRDLGINTALMGVCSNGDYLPQEPIVLSGHVLSIYETSDVVRSCEKLLDRSKNGKSTSEIAISTGLGHGAFYTPITDWIRPLKDWLRATASR